MTKIYYAPPLVVFCALARYLSLVTLIEVAVAPLRIIYATAHHYRLSWPQQLPLRKLFLSRLLQLPPLFKGVPISTIEHHTGIIPCLLRLIGLTLYTIILILLDLLLPLATLMAERAPNTLVVFFRAGTTSTSPGHPVVLLLDKALWEVANLIIPLTHALHRPFTGLSYASPTRPAHGPRKLYHF